MPTDTLSDALSPTSPARFVRHGRSFHLEIRDAEDLRQAMSLDIARWVANGAPIETINADPVLLAMLDDGDARLRAEEIHGAIDFALSTLSDLSGLEAGSDSLALDAIDLSSLHGEALLSSARRVLRRSEGGEEAAHVTLAQVRSVREEEEARGLSEAGLILPAAAPDEATSQLLTAILDTVGGAPHPQADAAVDVEHLELFLEQLKVHSRWRQRANEEETRASIMPFGEETEAVAALVKRLRPKIVQFFTLCDALALDERMREHVWPGKARYEQVDFVKQEAVLGLLEGAPITHPNSEGVIPEDAVINPVYRAPLSELEESLGGELPRDRAAWAKLERELEAWEQWLESEPEVSVASLPLERQRAILEDTDTIDAVRALLARSEENAVVLDRVKNLERLILLQANLLTVANSFISFPDLYDPTSRALFERGTLIIDGRRLTLAIQVPDRDRHAKFSDASNIFVLYTEIMSVAGEVLFEVAVPVTSGGRGNLLESKWGVFEDVDGKEYHARVVHIVDNPISLIEAILAPFAKLGAALDARLEKLSSSQQDALVEKGSAKMAEKESAFKAKTDLTAKSPEPTPDAAAAKPTPPAPSEATASAPASQPAASSSNTGSLLAGGGVAIAAIGSSLAFVTSTLQKIGWSTIVLTILGLLLALLVPLVLQAWIKLRRRDLSALLEGSGWGINTRMRLTREQAKTFTFTPPFPEGALGTPKRRLYLWLLPIALLIALGVAAYYDLFDSFLS